MLGNYLKIAWRNLLINKGYFAINLLGLSIALTVSLLMLLWVQDEYGMDKFHANDDRLFRVKRTIPLEDGILDVYNGISYPLLKTAKEQLPEIEGYIALGRSFEDNLKLDNVDFRAKGTFTNADFFSGFSFPVLAGDINQLDKKPEALVISESLALRFWGAEWPQKAIGSTVTILDNGDFTVEAVYKDFPKQSSIQNDFYYSLDKFVNDNDWMTGWGNNGMEGAVVLRSDADPGEVSLKMNQLFQANIPGELKESCFLQKFSDDYLYNQFDEKAQVSGGRIEYVRIFTLAAIFLLLISCINFVNLSTAHATKRAGEIGVRKVIGAKRNNLMQQFLTETSLITGISFVLAFIFTFLLLPGVNNLVEKQLSLNLTEPLIWMGIIGAFVFTTLLSGVYPALVISSFRPIVALKGPGKERKNNISLRKALVVLQFGLTSLLIVAALIVRSQIEYINQKDLGIAKEQLISIHQDEALTSKYEVLRNQLLASNAIEDVTLAGPSPLDMVASSSGVSWPGKTLDQENIDFSLLWTAHNFNEVFDVPLNEGIYYREGSVDTLNIVLNEKAVEIMGLEDPVGKTIQLWRRPRQIIGVLKDFHNRSLYEPIQPAVFLLDPDNAGHMFVKLKAEKTKDALEALQDAFAQTLPNLPLHYNFLDQEYAAAYKSETLTGTLAYYFAIISILISCLGLFGLATFMAKQRTKEIGIRKVLGASITHIITLISKDLMRLVLLAVLIASPLAHYAMSAWLRNFEYRIQIHWSVFVLTGGLALLITLLTIGWQSLKSAKADPVKSLRTE